MKITHSPHLTLTGDRTYRKTRPGQPACSVHGSELGRGEGTRADRCRGGNRGPAQFPRLRRERPPQSEQPLSPRLTSQSTLLSPRRLETGASQETSTRLAGPGPRQTFLKRKRPSRALGQPTRRPRPTLRGLPAGGVPSKERGRKGRDPSLLPPSTRTPTSHKITALRSPPPPPESRKVLAPESGRIWRSSVQAPCVRPRALHESGNLGRERKFSWPCADTACSRTGAGHGHREGRPREERPRIPPALDRNAQCTARAARGRAVLRVPTAASPYPRRPRPQDAKRTPGDEVHWAPNTHLGDPSPTRI